MEQNKYFNTTKQQSAIGVVSEKLESETRVAMTPNAVREITQNNHTVYVQSGAGVRSGFTDESYKMAGATMLYSAEEVYQRSDIMMKVAKPTVQEYKMIKPEQVIFCFKKSGEKHQECSNFESNMAQRQAVVFFYENLETESKTSPVVKAISEVSGYLAVQEGMKYMETQFGRTLGRVAGEHGANVLILGSGTAAFRAATVASAIGAKVTIMDQSTEKLRWVSDKLSEKVQTLMYNSENLERMLPITHLLIGAAMPSKTSDWSVHNVNSGVPLISNNQMDLLQNGAVAIDLAMSMGGNFEASMESTNQMSNEKSIMLWNGKILINAESDITKRTPRTTSDVISNSILPYVLLCANNGWRKATQWPELKYSMSVAEGRVLDLYTKNETVTENRNFKNNYSSISFRENMTPFTIDA